VLALMATAYPAAKRRANFVDFHDLGQPCAKTITFGRDQKRGGVFRLSSKPSASFCARAVLEPSIRVRHLLPMNGLGEVRAPRWRDDHGRSVVTTFFSTLPSFITKTTFSVFVMSFLGSPEMATTSASFPSARLPTWSDAPSGSQPDVRGSADSGHRPVAIYEYTP
jgi:hypothetical protein